MNRNSPLLRWFATVFVTVSIACGVGTAQAQTAKVSADLLSVASAPAGTTPAVPWARALPTGLHVQVLVNALSTDPELSALRADILARGGSVIYNYISVRGLAAMVPAAAVLPLAARTDVLSMLVRAADDEHRQMTDRELRDQLMTLLAAGHDTTATSLSWALERLTRHPDVLAKAVAAAEAGAAGDPAGDEYLDAIAKETLRIRPVVFDVGRLLKAPVDIVGYHLPAGVMVAPGIGLVHASPAQYRNPETFDPDRMIGATLGPTTWLPFGGGNRRCLGATFAMAEMRIVLREVLRRVELSTTAAADERQRVRHVILEPNRGAAIRLRSRRDQRAPAAESPAQPTAQCPVVH